MADFVRLLRMGGIVALTTAAGAANADTWGCQVLLCLSNPSGPTAVKECEPPINRLWKALNKRHPDPFPSCEEAKAQGSWAEKTTSWYDPCPEGTTALPAGSRAVRASDVDVSAGYAALRPDAPVLTGVGEGLQYTGAFDETRQAKVCVGKQLGVAMATNQNGDGASVAGVVPCYDRIAMVDPATSPNAINVHVDSKLVRVVRYGAGDTNVAEATEPKADEVPAGMKFGKTQVYRMPNVVRATQGASATFRLRFYGVVMPWVTKPALHLRRADGSTLTTTDLEVGNHYWQLPSDGTDGHSHPMDWEGYYQFDYPYLVNAAFIPAGTYTVVFLAHQGFEPYHFDPSLYECAPGVARVEQGCDIGQLVVEASGQQLDGALFRPQGYTVMKGTTWHP